MGQTGAEALLQQAVSLHGPAHTGGLYCTGGVSAPDASGGGGGGSGGKPIGAEPRERLAPSAHIKSSLQHPGPCFQTRGRLLAAAPPSLFRAGPARSL